MILENNLTRITSDCIREYVKSLPDLENSKNVLPFLRNGIPPIIINRFKKETGKRLNERQKKIIQNSFLEVLERENKIEDGNFYK